MSIASIFIRRPVATSLLGLAIALVGLVAYKLLPVAALPQVDYPTISVSANLPGASPETMAATVATPLERAFGTIAGVTELTSTSTLGSTRITVQMDLDQDVETAAKSVQAAINATRPQLPSGMAGNPSYRKINPADAPVLILAMTSDSVSRAAMYDFASTVLAQRLSQVKGVGQVNLGGGSLPAVRVEVDPATLASAGIGVESVRQAIDNANVNRPKGSLEGGQRHWQLGASDQASKAADYIPTIVSWKNGAAVRLQDVARVSDAEQDTRNTGIADGKPAVILLINRQPDANVIETVERAMEVLPMLREELPPGVKLDVVADRTVTIRASLREVQHTLLLSVALVIMVVFLFLRNVRAAIIPSVAVPVSLLGTFAVMYLAGFSLNNISLMALVIVTGFVVDDAVVVLENVSRHIEAGMKPFDAALKGAREVGFTVLSMSLSLIAVFLPILLMGGIIGRFFREFAVTLSAAILVSLVVSLTLTPMMCARLLRAHPKPAPDARPGFGSRLMDGVLRGYGRSLRVVLDHPWLTLGVLLGTMAFNVYLYGVVPKGFFPQQDTGRIMGFIDADQRTSFQSMRGKLEHFAAIVGRDPAVANVVGYAGGSGGPRGGGGMMFVTLKPLAERDASADEVIARLRGKLGHVPGASLFLVAAQDIRMGGRMSNAQYEFTLQADSLKDLKTWEPRIRDAMRKLPQLEDVNSDRQDKGEQTFLSIDRDALARLGLNQRLVNATLNDLFGQRLVSTIYGPLNQYRVVLEAPPAYLQGPEVLNDLFFVSPAGARVPLAAFARWEAGPTPLAVNHQGGSVATTISFNLPLGTSLSEATDAVRQEMARIGVPTSVHGSFQGNAKAFQASLQSQPLLILAAIVAVYLILGILYESLIHPLTILSTLPSAGVGAILALLLFKTEFGIIALIGVILLIGIVKKNAIMMVDFAIDAERSRGLAPREAIFEACQLRFRPIMMTTLAALFGALPLAFGVGDGAEMRQPLGITIVGGLILSQLLTLYTTPVVFLQLDRLRRAAGRWRSARLAIARP
ncbi:multidrug efflux RND transporter permease subunit [Zoogloea sp.]|uniref:multidrug efflux RND transporter permease subunit n=1 Tax=Zoogloea sp. TaxID=49181 RepID=UPI0035B0E103